MVFKKRMARLENCLVKCSGSILWTQTSSFVRLSLYIVCLNLITSDYIWTGFFQHEFGSGKLEFHNSDIGILYIYEFGWMGEFESGHLGFRIVNGRGFLPISWEQIKDANIANSSIKETNTNQISIKESQTVDRV